MAKKQRGMIGELKRIIERSEKIGKISDKDKTVIYGIISNIIAYDDPDNVFNCFDRILRIHNLLKRLWKLDSSIVECHRDPYSYNGNYCYHMAKVRTSWCSQEKMPYLIPASMVKSLSSLLKEHYNIEISSNNIAEAICCRNHDSLESVVGTDLIDKQMGIELDAQTKDLLNGKGGIK